MSKIKRGKLSLEKRQALEQWGKYPTLSIMYNDVEEYAQALRKIEEKAKADEYLEGLRKTSILVNRGKDNE